MTKPKKLFLDIDIGADCDDASALELLLEFEKEVLLRGGLLFEKGLKQQRKRFVIILDFQSR